jgi:hypothetical protein
MPPPLVAAELPAIVQLIKVPPHAPPPNAAELPLKLQLFKVELNAPPPKLFVAKLFIKMQ